MSMPSTGRNGHRGAYRIFEVEESVDLRRKARGGVRDTGSFQQKTNLRRNRTYTAKPQRYNGT